MSTEASMDHRDTPVLLITFNRLESTVEVLNAIRDARIKRLYLASDHGRNEEERKVVSEIRSRLLSMIDWECEVKTLFQSENQGCKHGVSSAIDWFFEHEEMGMILEDDCLPNASFFPFCSEMLHRYRSDKRVWMISGNNLLERKETEYSYFFTQIYSSIWGWATWRDRWQEYDIEMKEYKQVLRSGELEQSFNQKQIFRLRMQEIGSIFDGVDTWDHQWVFCRLINHGKCIIPSLNLIKNIGFGLDATHTQNANSKLADLKTFELDFPLKHPMEMVIDDHFELELYKQLPVLTFLDHIKIRIKRLLGMKL